MVADHLVPTILALNNICSSKSSSMSCNKKVERLQNRFNRLTNFEFVWFYSTFGFFSRDAENWRLATG